MSDHHDLLIFEDLTLDDFREQPHGQSFSALVDSWDIS